MGSGFDPKGGGKGGGRRRDVWGRSICAWKIYIIFGDHSDGFRKNKPVYHVYRASHYTYNE